MCFLEEITILILKFDFFPICNGESCISVGPPRQGGKVDDYTKVKIHFTVFDTQLFLW